SCVLRGVRLRDDLRPCADHLSRGAASPDSLPPGPLPSPRVAPLGARRSDRRRPRPASRDAKVGRNGERRGDSSLRGKLDPCERARSTAKTGPPAATSREHECNLRGGWDQPLRDSSAGTGERWARSSLAHVYRGDGNSPRYHVRRHVAVTTSPSEKRADRQRRTGLVGLVSAWRAQGLAASIRY